MSSTLLVDVGNSAIKWTWLENSASIGRVDTQFHREDEPSDVLDRCWSGMRKPASIWVASVIGPKWLYQFTLWTQKYWGIRPETVNSEPKAFGVESGYSDYRFLGVDRWLAIVAAYRNCADACCIVDCGTAATVDVVSAEGRHLGGYILPGVHSSRRALLEFTRIPRVGHVDVCSDLGDDTATAVELGGRLAIVGVIERAMNFIKVNSPAAKLFLAGSEAELLRQWMPQNTRWSPHLVLEGLAHYAARRL